MIQNQALIDRFLRYVKIDTQSQEKTGEVPSTAKQHDLAKLLVRELQELGVKEIDYDTEHCIVYAAIPATTGAGSEDEATRGSDTAGVAKSGLDTDDSATTGSGSEDEAPRGTDTAGAASRPAIGFIAHMDTSNAVSGANVQPRFLMNYDGHDELLPLDAFPSLKEHLGEDLIATDGTTLLGADDKAGVAEIMNLVEYLQTHPEVPHRAVAVAFTPDEEIGHGVDHFDPARFAAKEAYTVDGGTFGGIEYESFHAAAAEVTIRGVSVHPGSAKGLMKNAAILAMEFNAALPEAERPEHTEGREGFFMLMEMQGEVEHATMEYIVRDHDRARFEERKEKLRKIANDMNARYGEETVIVELTDQYYNMAEVLEDHKELIRDAEEAIRALGGEPFSEPIRGGTDGSRLTFMGIPCPNLGTGGYNFHSRYEYACIREMEQCAETLIRLATN